MNKQEIISFINSNLACSLATVEEGEPRVRGMLAYRADEEGIIFHTGSTKSLYSQLKADGKVEICFSNMEQGCQVRVKGIAEEIDDETLKEEIISQREFLKNWQEVGMPGHLAVFKVRECAATEWTFATNFETTTYVKL